MIPPLAGNAKPQRSPLAGGFEPCPPRCPSRWREANMGGDRLRDSWQASAWPSATLNSPTLHPVIASDHSHPRACGVMISKADAIIIGSGGLGAATAYYLSQRKKLSIALIDKRDIGSQTSPRAAGMVSCARKSDLMISLIKDACRKIEAFTEETGQPLDWVH
jgi:FAD dependent oxidoreductase